MYENPEGGHAPSADAPSLEYNLVGAKLAINISFKINWFTTGDGNASMMKFSHPT